MNSPFLSLFDWCDGDYKRNEGRTIRANRIFDWGISLVVIPAQVWIEDKLLQTPKTLSNQMMTAMTTTAFRIVLMELAIGM
jgi:hypothetical protein